MNRFDRVTSLLLLLQTRSVVTARFLSDHFAVTERTIYRDIRTLENAGVPIGSEAGVGYFLEKGYRLPPVSFSLDEAASLLLGEKLLVSSLDEQSLEDYSQALNKVRAVLEKSDKDYLSSLDSDIEVLTNTVFTRQADKNVNPESGDSLLHGDRWLRECRTVLVRRQVAAIHYTSGKGLSTTVRHVEPIGLFYYSRHWHLIAWCRLREAYRDFRLDRIEAFEAMSEQFARHSRKTLQQYMAALPGESELMEVELKFIPEAARYVGEQKYMFGFISELQSDDVVFMSFMTATPVYMARWLLQYTDGVEVVRGEKVRDALKTLTQQLQSQWGDKDKPS